jgi:hypothetical protein
MDLEGSGSARVRHMLETLNDLKNNKKRQAQVSPSRRRTTTRLPLAQRSLW